MTGYEKLKEVVERDCQKGKGNGCFNPNGCDQEFHKYVPAEGEQKKFGKTVCMVNTKCFHQYCNKFKWVIDRAKHYEEKTGIPWEEILNSWEGSRNYSYMNYYQDCNQPEIKGDKVRVFETVKDMIDSLGEKKFRCPAYGEISTSPYACNSGKIVNKKECDWKVYGLFGDLGKGIFVFCKDKVKGETIFMPVSWEVADEHL